MGDPIRIQAPVGRLVGMSGDRGPCMGDGCVHRSCWAFQWRDSPLPQVNLCLPCADLATTPEGLLVRPCPLQPGSVYPGWMEASHG